MQRLVLCVMLALCTVPAFAQIYQVLPTDEIWVYANSSHPAGDPVLRIATWNYDNTNPLYSESSDITGDDVNDIDDLLMLIQNYNVEGA